MIAAGVFVRAGSKAVGHPAGGGTDGGGEVVRSFGVVNGKGTEKGLPTRSSTFVMNLER